jgi:hypothetical protein
MDLRDGKARLTRAIGLVGMRGLMGAASLKLSVVHHLDHCAYRKTAPILFA